MAISAGTAARAVGSPVLGVVVLTVVVVVPPFVVVVVPPFVVVVVPPFVVVVVVLLLELSFGV